MLRTVDDYLAHITPYHRGKPAFSDTVAASVTDFADLQAFLHFLFEAFDIDTGIGAQLDVIGDWVGRSRVIPIPIKPPWFTIGDGLRGIGAGYLFQDGISFGSTNAVLDDETFRALLFAKIAANNWDGSHEGAKAALEIFFNEVFGALVVVHDDGPMSVIIGLAQTIPPTPGLYILARSLITVKAAGVATSYCVTTVDDAPLFGIGVDNDRVAGIGSGAIGAAPELIAQRELP